MQINLSGTKLSPEPLKWVVNSFSPELFKFNLLLWMCLREGKKDIQSQDSQGRWKCVLLWVTKEVKFFSSTLCAIDIIASSRGKNLPLVCDLGIGHWSIKVVLLSTIAFIFYLFLFFYFFFISWRLITIQYCSGFCHTLKWISHGFTCVPHPDPPSHLPLHPIPLGLPSAPNHCLYTDLCSGHFT